MVSIPLPESTSADPRWLVVLARDPRADGTFWSAVRTTRIYCRPSCPSRHARCENVTFYDTPAQARADGYRPCLRCQPDEVSVHEQLVARVQHLLDTVSPAPSLGELAAAVELSPFHLQRVFKRATGLSPKQYALRARTERLKGELRDGARVTPALYEAGHTSSRTLYDRGTDQLGMTPTAYQRGGAHQTIGYTLTDSALGRMLVAATAHGLCAVRFDEDEALVGELRAEYPRAELVEDAPGLAPYLEALRRIPPGETRSYAQVAEKIGAPSAVRSVARACATNPVALVVPCHRVVRTGGALAGYRWGIERKQALLHQERAFATD